MHILHQNMRGLYNNFNQLIDIFETHKKVAIMTLSETHIINNGHNDNVALYHIEGFSLIKNNVH